MCLGSCRRKFPHRAIKVNADCVYSSMATTDSISSDSHLSASQPTTPSASLKRVLGLTALVQYASTPSRVQESRSPCSIANDHAMYCEQLKWFHKFCVTRHTMRNL